MDLEFSFLQVNWQEYQLLYHFLKIFLFLKGTAVLLGLGIHRYQNQSQELSGQVTQPRLIEFDQANGEPVILNVYDIFWANEYTENIGLGVYHSGLEVYGREYAYGGHPFPSSGIFDTAPRAAAGVLGEHFRFKQAIHLGNTDFRAFDVEKFREELGRKFQGDRYHLISRNCNHFSGAFSSILCGRDIPGWINRLAYFSTFVPFLLCTLTSVFFLMNKN